MDMFMGDTRDRDDDWEDRERDWLDRDDKRKDDKRDRDDSVDMLDIEDAMDKELCYDNIQTIEKWYKDQLKGNKETKEKNRKLIEGIWKASKETGVSLTGNKDFFGWATSYDTMLGAARVAECFDDGICMEMPWPEQEIVDMFVYAEPFDDKKEMKEALDALFEWRQSVNLEAPMMVGMPYVPDVSMCKNEKKREYAEDMREEIMEGITGNLEYQNKVGFYT